VCFGFSSMYLLMYLMTILAALATDPRVIAAYHSAAAQAYKAATLSRAVAKRCYQPHYDAAKTAFVKYRAAVESTANERLAVRASADNAATALVSSVEAEVAAWAAYVPLREAASEAAQVADAAYRPAATAADRAFQRYRQVCMSVCSSDVHKVIVPSMIFTTLLGFLHTAVGTFSPSLGVALGLIFLLGWDLPFDLLHRVPCVALPAELLIHSRMEVILYMQAVAFAGSLQPLLHLFLSKGAIAILLAVLMTATVLAPARFWTI